MPWHFLFEALAYGVGFRIYAVSRARSGDFLDAASRACIIAAAIVGAALGAKLLYWVEDPVRTLRHWNDLAYLFGGKTIVGALLGGTLTVEIVKRRMGIRSRTGDLFAIPLAAGIAIGRIGCLLAGLSDDTYGSPTSLPWGFDLGDGVRRHPVQIYEIAVMLVLVALLVRIHPPRFAEGDRFRIFLFSYCVWRVFIDSFKPGFIWHGLTPLQWACGLATLWYGRDIWRITCRRIPAKIAVHG